MSRLKALTILFDSTTNVFAPGDVISGQVIVQVDANRDQEGLKNVQGMNYLCNLYHFIQHPTAQAPITRLIQILILNIIKTVKFNNKLRKSTKHKIHIYTHGKRGKPHKRTEKKNHERPNRTIT